MLFGKLSRKVAGETIVENTDISWTWEMWNRNIWLNTATVWILWGRQTRTETIVKHETPTVAPTTRPTDAPTPPPSTLSWWTSGYNNF